jgi:two-component system chemotaxis sensor kinase CheA
LRALERGIVSADELDRMSEREVADLIFRPGFSTAEVVTNVSGRGVGMDVVRTNIEKIGGTVDLQSVPGSGTTVRIKVPLTLAIIPALLVGCREARYAIPQAAVQELVRLEGETIRTGIERIDDAMVYRLRGRLLPLVRLDTSLGHDLESLEDRPSVDIVVVRTDGDAIGLVVDDVHETQEIVVKPLNSQLKAIPIFAGATILGDGGVALILDVTGLAQAARVSDTHAGIVSSQHLTGSAQSGVESLLILRVGENRRVAVPLAQVVRLEEIEASRVEHAGSRQVIQYRNDLLPLVWLSDLVGVAPGSSDSTGLHVVVSSDGKRTVGFVAEEILDVVEEVVSLKPIGRSSGLCGTVVVQGMAADLLDIPTALERSGVSLLSDDELRDAMEEMNADVY